MKRVISPQDAAALIPAGASVMVGGFMGCGNAHAVLAALAEAETGDLTVISNDASMLNGPNGEEYYGLAKLVHNRQIKKLIATHVGLNPEVAEQMNDGTLEVVLIPQGSMAEMIRAGGAGLGGVLTTTGYGTPVQGGMHVHGTIDINGKTYLVELPLRADYAIISGHFIDQTGNIWYKGTTRNFNQVMATAADTVIAEADNLVAIGDIVPENVMTPGVLVDYIVSKGGNQ
ncbi:3-oxoacid CoA-transferase subunit A [Ruminococcaceae bacterium OttesenSCG-928-D13]|nr:3-oxoacid CoA-transferase subunit A [Ruminococcaceae bacterium OttesenSCG-928-D13]